MQFIAFYLTIPFLYLISLLPFRVIYLISDFICFIVYNIIGYRKKTVRNNLEIGLPHLSFEERLIIEKRFYHHMCDMFLEMIKTITISDKEIEKRFKFKNLEVYSELENKNKSIVLLCSHYASYEWVVSMNRKIKFNGYGIYKKINNKYFDDFVRKVRSRFNTVLITTKITSEIIEKNQVKGIKGVYGFASDQSPENKKKNFWTQFLEVEVPVYTGAEMLAKRYDMSVIFLKVEKLKRGYYQAEFETMELANNDLKDYSLTVEYLKKVEKQIYEAPEFYLWTHKRFKHAGKKHLSY